MSEPIYCEIKGQYCRCHEVGRRCDDFDEDETVPEKPQPTEWRWR